MEEEDKTFMNVDVAVQTMEEGLTERILGIDGGPNISRTVINEENSLMFLEHQNSLRALEEPSAFLPGPRETDRMLNITNMQSQTQAKMGPPSHSKMLEISDYKEEENYQTLVDSSMQQRDTEMS